MNPDEKELIEAAKRCAWHVTIALMADRERAVNSWLAIRLVDGECDEVLYAKREDAVRAHMNLGFQYCYIKIPVDGMNEEAAYIFMKFNRRLHAAGMRMSDPEQGEREVIMPMGREFMPWH